MAYRKIPMSRKRLLEAYWRDGVKQPLRVVAEDLNVSHNTARNWLIKFDLYESESPNRGKNKKNASAY
jgi:transposase